MTHRSPPRTKMVEPQITRTLAPPQCRRKSVKSVSLQCKLNLWLFKVGMRGKDLLDSLDFKGQLSLLRGDQGLLAAQPDPITPLYLTQYVGFCGVPVERSNEFWPGSLDPGQARLYQIPKTRDKFYSTLP